MENNEQVLTEMQSFLQALDSYPERFAQDPDVTFEQHRSSLAAAAETEPAIVINGWRAARCHSSADTPPSDRSGRTHATTRS
jgi:hypothetical protein